jgi:aminoglycoside/choline kinase family phosphotransferase
VLGIFARLWLRDGKPGYLNDLPLVLRYTMEIAARYPQAADFVEWMQVRVLPACQRQPWWKEIK